MSKKLGAQFLARMEAAKAGKRTAPEEPKNPKKIKICLDLTAEPETAESYLNKVLGSSSKQDRLIRDAVRKKNGIMWEKFPSGGPPPPPPPVWETPVIKKKSWVYFSF